MRNLIVAISFLAIHACSFGASSTNELTLFRHRARHQAYEWRIPEAMIPTLPRWNFEKKPTLPLSPAKACRIARDWFEKRGQPSPNLVRVEIVPFAPTANYNENKDKRELDFLRDRYFYKIQWNPAPLDFMYVIVLMDGRVVEPVPVRSWSAEESR
jgi:hypothetical protein